jgi:hypothetical protein
MRLFLFNKDIVIVGNNGGFFTECFDLVRAKFTDSTVLPLAFNSDINDLATIDEAVNIVLQKIRENFVVIFIGGETRNIQRMSFANVTLQSIYSTNLGLDAKTLSTYHLWLLWLIILRG